MPPDHDAWAAVQTFLDWKDFGAKLADVGILPYQDKDGAWWDFAMWDFHKPYGTAYAVMTLLRCE